LEACSNTCLLEYARAANQLYLFNDAGTGWLAPATVGAAGTLSNSQCSISMAAANVTTSGTNLTLSLPMMFPAAFAGAKITYMYDGGSIANSGWQPMGTWTRMPYGAVFLHRKKRRHRNRVRRQYAPVHEVMKCLRPSAPANRRGLQP
jgi:hypothetical protein